MSQINYDKKCVAMGRNGTSYQTGLHISQVTRTDENNIPFDILILTPINSYGQLTNCWVEIPTENLIEFNDIIKRNAGVQGTSCLFTE